MNREAERTLKEADTLQRRIGRLDGETEELRRARRRLWLKANRQGARYREIVERTGFQGAYIGKQIAKARQENPELAETPDRIERLRETAAGRAADR